MAKRDLSSPLSWDYDLYSPAQLEAMTEKELRREYTKLRDALNKRYKRMLADPDYKHSAAALDYKTGGGLKKLRDVKTKHEMAWTVSMFAYDIVEGSSSIERMEAEKAERKKVTDEYLPDGSDDSSAEISDEERGRFWQWIKSKYNNAYLPPSDVTNEEVTNILSGDRGRAGRRIIFGQWRANEYKESEFQYVRTSTLQ